MTTTTPTTDRPDRAPTPRGRRIRWISLAVVALTIVTGAVFGSRLGKDPNLVDSPMIGKPVPAATLPFLEGKGSLSLASLRGKVVVVNFWASWCVPCRTEHPALVSTARDYAKSGVVFVGVNYQDRRGSAVAFLDELGRGEAASYRYVTDPGSKLALGLGVFGVPETYFLDRTGKIVGKITGPSDRPVLAAALDAILAGRTPESSTDRPVQPAPSK
ncbi:thiol:disulfide interchange protein DsbE [Streptomyces zinciresistens K42]|uniref:Thiol:disulfide interchange protein DsbE n=1 Tax=Streptomyces zinciresistens K42 TaxID=700597 RepID=G2GNU9_9ACTN|nr:TlpA disulfide reductase family protein [Streptomyces zinciresistens]EGX54811.1 thiol:disulfide interchange protein DsbE [Streptomyces zinciresistens K42]